MERRFGCGDGPGGSSPLFPHHGLPIISSRILSNYEVVCYEGGSVEGDQYHQQQEASVKGRDRYAERKDEDRAEFKRD